MSTHLVDEAIEAWAGARGLVTEEARNIPAEKYEFRPTPQTRSVAELLVHIMEVSQMMVGELCRSDGDFRRKPFPDLIAEYAGHLLDLRQKTPLLEALDETLASGTRRFRRAGAEHLLQPIRRFDGQTGSRLDWMHHGIGQEMYHGGQLALYTRLMGSVPALTRRIRGES